MIASDLSISYTDNEIDDLRGAYANSIEAPNHLTTVTEESSSIISLLEESEIYEKAKDLHQISHDCTTEETVKSLNERDYFRSSVFELARCLWKSTLEEQHYTKGCVWSPDGTCVLVPVHLDGMHVIELPRELYNTTDSKRDRELNELKTAVHVKEGGTVYDFAWYPFMNSESPDSCCWLATRQHEPIHLWDAFTGELRCSYRGYDQVDEVESAISVIFSNGAEKVIGGYKKSIKVFDTNTPGRKYTSIPVKKAVSCFAFTQQSDLTVTTGSWKGYIDHYDLRAPKMGSLFTLGFHSGGITWLKYSKTEPLMLFSGARRDNKLLQWDMRNYKEPLREFKRSVTTNQRIYFDLSPQEQWLVSGDCSGLLHVWGLTKPETKSVDITLHSDCCNGVSFHPYLPILATSSGQYHFLDVAGDAPETNSPEEEIVNYENSLIFLLLNATGQDS